MGAEAIALLAMVEFPFAAIRPRVANFGKKKFVTVRQLAYKYLDGLSNSDYFSPEIILELGIWINGLGLRITPR